MSERATLRPPAAGPTARVQAHELRLRGYAGGVIPVHRAILTLRREPSKFLQSALLVVAILAAWLLVLFGWTTSAWAWALRVFQDWLGLGADVSMVSYNFLGLYRFEVPRLGFSSGLPDSTTLWIGAFTTLGVFVASFLLPRRSSPLIYALRVVALAHSTAEIFFWLMPEAFPYDGSGYVHGMLIASLALISITPLTTGLTYYIFDFSILRKAGLTLLVMLHLAVLVPMQYAAQAFVLHHGSLLTMPLLFLVFGLPLDVMAFIALYGWAMSWKNQLVNDDHILPRT